MRLLFIGIIAALFLSSCASTTATSVIGPDGTENILVTCYNTKECYEKAREVCGGTYKINNTSSKTSGVDGLVSSATNLLIKCDK